MARRMAQRIKRGDGVMVSAASSKRTNFPRGTWSGSKWSSFDDGYYHDALFPATVSIFHLHVGKKQLGRSVCVCVCVCVCVWVGGCMHRTGVASRTGKHDDDRHVTTDSCTRRDRAVSATRGCWLSTTDRVYLFPRNRVFRHYIIHSFTQNIIVANMSLMSEISGPYCDRPCVMRFSRFRFDQCAYAAVHGRRFSGRLPLLAGSRQYVPAKRIPVRRNERSLDCNFALALSLVLFPLGIDGFVIMIY